MDERAKLMAGSVLGAVLGVAVSYLFFTARGRTWRKEIGPHVDDLIREVGRVHHAVEHFRESVSGRTSGSDAPSPTWPRRSA